MYDMCRWFWSRGGAAIGTKKSALPFLILISLLQAPAFGFQEAPADREEGLRSEEAEDYYRKWLSEDVVYIITDEERAVFEELTTEAEKESFIEQFWWRRDPDLKTAENEFREEHYRRIAYANERFTSGKAGWKTDRGRIYIIHGPPFEIQESFGGPYERPMYEGGGQTTTFPYQVWRYRKIDGLGDDIELEFVDTTLTGDYHLAKDHWEKDAFAHVPNIGLTLAEERGLATKKDRFIADGGLAYYPMLALRGKDRPFQRLERYAGIMRPPKLHYQDLQRIVEVDVSFSSLPFRLHQDHFRLNETHVIVPLTIEIASKDLTYEEDNGMHRAKVAIYGTVTDLSHTIIKEFEDDLMSTISQERLEQGLRGTSMYQKVLVLERGKRVKLDLVIKDLTSGKVGALSKVLVPPKYSENDLQTSSLILTDTLQQLDYIPEESEMFVLGNTRVRPSLDRVFPVDKLMGTYLQVYNAGLDQATLEPALKVKYRLSRDGQPLMEIVDESGESVQFFSASRVVLTRTFSPASLGPGKYRILIEVIDTINNQMATVSDRFEIVEESRLASR